MAIDCSHAAALRELNLRDFALPFDWIQINTHSLESCFKDNFNNFNKNVRYCSVKNRIIDHYGFEYSHDYPLNDISNNNFNNGEGEYDGNEKICSNWYD